ncbi:DUF805 domain-containing protein [Arthrobacter sp. JSM 101049]|uniref:DUF805 domain-containing protein n=1 Tax=Arthrobacter sp. JSM 101049 TaxID=929097 RepID=UPI00356A42C9
MSNGYPTPYPSGPTGTPSNGEVALDQPLYGASFGQSIKRFFTKYATFSGRASRSEYWWAALFNAIIVGVLYTVFIVLLIGSIDPVTGEADSMGFVLPMLLLGLYGLAVIVPNIAITVRRLHDANFSGLLYLLVLVPGVGGLVLLVLALMPSSPEGARYDADGGAAAHANAFGGQTGYPGAPTGGFAGQNAPQGYQQPGTQQDFGQPGGPTRR